MYEGLINNLNKAADKWKKEHPIIGVGQLRVHDALRDAARALKEADSKLEQVTLERDAVMRDMNKNCASCKYAGCNNPKGDGCPYVEQCQNYVKWQWRGIQKEDRQ